MAEETVQASGSDFMDLFDSMADGGLACRVCGSLVAPEGEYPRAHWDWHEATNGA